MHKMKHFTTKVMYVASHPSSLYTLFSRFAYFVNFNARLFAGNPTARSFSTFSPLPSITKPPKNSENIIGLWIVSPCSISVISIFGFILTFLLIA